MYQSRKVIFHDLYEIDDLIRNAKDAKEAKRISKQSTMGRLEANHSWRNSES